MATVPSPSTEARALALAAVLGGGDRAPALLARIGGRDGEVARTEAARMLAMPRDQRADLLAAEAAQLRATRPAGLAEVHPTWIEAGLAGEDGRLRAILGGAAVAPAVRVWVERRVLGALRPMTPDPAAMLRSAADLAGARGDWLALRLDRIGVRQLAHATADAPKVELAALASRLGFVRARAYVDAVTRVRALPDAPERLGPRRAAQSRCDGIRLSRDPLAFLAIGARALAAHVAADGGDLPWQIAQRLPHGPGARVLDELLLWREAAISDAPAWAEIAG